MSLFNQPNFLELVKKVQDTPGYATTPTSKLWDCQYTSHRPDAFPVAQIQHCSSEAKPYKQ